jgi:hypothetical protein
MACVSSGTGSESHSTSVPHAVMLARENAEIGAGIRHLKAAPASWWLRPTTFAHSPAKPCPRRVRGSTSLSTLVTLDP